MNRNDDDDYHEYDESSDPGMGGDGTPGYRAVPSDTDTSAVDSDPYGHGLEDTVQSGRHKRLGKRKKNFKNHDEAWFMSHDSKGKAFLKWLLLLWWALKFQNLTLCLVHVIWTERRMSKLKLNVKYLLLLSFLTASEFYNLGHIQGIIRVH